MANIIILLKKKNFYWPVFFITDIYFSVLIFVVKTSHFLSVCYPKNKPY